MRNKPLVFRKLEPVPNRSTCRARSHVFHPDSSNNSLGPRQDDVFVCALSWHERKQSFPCHRASIASARACLCGDEGIYEANAEQESAFNKKWLLLECSIFEFLHFRNWSERNSKWFVEMLTQYAHTRCRESRQGAEQQSKRTHAQFLCIRINA